MSGSLIFLSFVVLMIIAAWLCLRGERRPPVLPQEDTTTGFRDPARTFERSHRIE